MSHRLDDVSKVLRERKWVSAPLDGLDEGLGSQVPPEDGAVLAAGPNVVIGHEAAVERLRRLPLHRATHHGVREQRN